MLWVLQHCVRRLPIRTCVCTYAANAGAFLDLNMTENKEHIVKKLKKTDYVIIAVLAALIACAAAWIVLGREKSGGTVSADEPEKTVSYEDYNGKRIGIITGSSFEQIAKNKFPDSECFYFNNYTDMAAALAQNKIDCFLGDEPVVRMMCSTKPELGYVKKLVTNEKYAFAFTKNDPKAQRLCEQLNEMLAEFSKDGTLQKMSDIWLGSDESKKVVDLEGFSGEKINIVSPSTNAPFCYIKNQKMVGYSVDLAARFCRRYGYEPVFEDVDFGASFAGVATGKYDMCASNVSVTDERKQSVLFSDAVYEGGVVLAVNSADLPVTKEVSQRDYKDYDGQKMGIITGSSFEAATFEYFPNSEYLYYNNYTDMAAALERGKIDGFVGDEPSMKLLCGNNKNITCLQKMLVGDDYAFVFTKGSEKTKKYREQFDEMLLEYKKDGTLDEIKTLWFGDDESKKVVDMSGLSGEKIKITTNSANAPFSYIKDHKLVGYSIDLVVRFCRRYGYEPVFEDVDFSTCVSAVAAGSADICASSASITEERKQSCDFSQPIYNGGLVLAVRNEKTETAVEEGFWEGLKSSFERNFIREDRWKLIVEGIGMTCAITALSVLFGSILAFAVCLFRRTGSVLANAISNLYVKLLQGTPIVVLLMILYYIVFGKTGMPAMWVAVIGFSLNFGAYVSEIMRSGIDSVDAGQREAALALGYTERQAFYRFIFPQAAVRFIPVYRGEIISLLKSTAIVGYIAIQDLTKMSDIIRSRTYEAFFPLIVTAIIYFILAWIISIVLNIVLRRIDKRRRKRNVKGVQTK